MKKNKNLEKEFETSLLFRIIIILCVLFFTFISILYLFSGLFPNTIKDFVMSDSFPKVLHFYRENLISRIMDFRLYYLIGFFVYIILNYGLLLIYKGSWLGFILFSTSLSIVLISPILIQGTRGIALGDIMLGFLLIIFFLIQISKAKIRYKKKIKANKVETTHIIEEEI